MTQLSRFRNLLSPSSKSPSHLGSYVRIVPTRACTCQYLSAILLVIVGSLETISAQPPKEPTPALNFSYPAPSSAFTSPSMIPNHNGSDLRFAAANGGTGRVPPRAGPGPQGREAATKISVPGGHVNFNKLQSLSRDVDQSVQSEEEVFGSLMSEVDRLGDVIRQQRAHKEQVLKEKQLAEAKAKAIEEELRNAQQAAEEARRRIAETQADQAQEAIKNPAPPVPVEPHDLRLRPAAPPVKESQGTPAEHVTPSDSSTDTHSHEHAAVETPPPLHGDAESPVPDELASAPAPKAVTNAAVDRQSLADSLFGSGEYKLALSTYRQLIKEEKTDKSAWLRFQVANCYRHLDELQQAEVYYREVAADRRDSFLSGTAKWWLLHLQERKELAARIDKWKMVASQIEKAANQ